jgi:hypothetical protein
MNSRRSALDIRRRGRRMYWGPSDLDVSSMLFFVCKLRGVFFIGCSGWGGRYLWFVWRIRYSRRCQGARLRKVVGLHFSAVNENPERDCSFPAVSGNERAPKPVCFGKVWGRSERPGVKLVLGWSECSRPQNKNTLIWCVLNKSVLRVWCLTWTAIGSIDSKILLVQL